MAKSVDLVGWRSCTKQRELGPKRFAITLKKLAHQATGGRSLPPPSSSVGASIALTPEQRRRQQANQELRQAAVSFEQGTPECPTCPISDGKAYGCYVAIECPIDAVAEVALFRYFTAQLDDERSAGFGIHRDLVAKVPSQGTPWHTDRGPTGDLAELETPLVKEWGFLLWKKRVDSAQLLGSLFFNQKRIGLISTFAVFWEGFVKEARATTTDFDGSPSLVQLEALSHFYERVLQEASTTDGIHILVENDAAPSGDRE